MASSGGASSSLPKWQLALVVGAPVALGLGYMYYKNCANKPEEKPGRGKPKRSTRENGEKQISIDGDFPVKPGNVPAAEVRFLLFLVFAMVCNFELYYSVF